MIRRRLFRDKDQQALGKTRPPVVEAEAEVEIKAELRAEIEATVDSEEMKQPEVNPLTVGDSEPR